MATRDLQWALRMMSDEFEINKEMIRHFVREELRKRKILALQHSNYFKNVVEVIFQFNWVYYQTYNTCCLEI
jgi:hypothetical protein